MNIAQRLDVSSDEVLQDLAAWPEHFVVASDADIWAAADRLKSMVGTTTSKEFALAEQALGLNYAPQGLMYDDRCRQLARPVTGWLRDWMHMLVVSGVANIEVQQVVLALRSRHCPILRPSVTLVCAQGSKILPECKERHTHSFAEDATYTRVKHIHISTFNLQYIHICI